MDILLETLFKYEVVSATVLTLGLFLLSIIYKDEILSEKARMKVVENSFLLNITLFFLFVPLILFIFAEIFSWMEYSGHLFDYEEIAELLEVSMFFSLNIGLLLALYFFIRIRGKINVFS